MTLPATSELERLVRLHGELVYGGRLVDAAAVMSAILAMTGWSTQKRAPKLALDLPAEWSDHTPDRGPQ